MQQIRMVNLLLHCSHFPLRNTNHSSAKIKRWINAINHHLFTTPPGVQMQTPYKDISKRKINRSDFFLRLFDGWDPLFLPKQVMSPEEHNWSSSPQVLNVNSIRITRSKTCIYLGFKRISLMAQLFQQLSESSYSPKKKKRLLSHFTIK